MEQRISASTLAAREWRCEASGITPPLCVFFIFAACVWFCSSSIAGPLRKNDRVIEADRSFEFFHLAGVSKWLDANKPEDGEIPHPSELIYEGDHHYYKGDYIEAIVCYELFLRAFSETKASKPLFSLVRDKLSAVYTLLGEKRFADDIIAKNGQRVSFGTRSCILHQECRGGEFQLHLTSANLYTVAKIINERSGKVVATVWLVPFASTPEFSLNLPAGVYQIVCAQEVRRNSRDEYSASVYRRLRIRIPAPAEAKGMHISIDSEAYVESTASTFGSFESLRRFEQPNDELIRLSLRSDAPDFDVQRLPDFIVEAIPNAIQDMQAELENPDTPDSRKEQLKSLISSHDQLAKDRGPRAPKPPEQAATLAAHQARKKLLDAIREKVAELDRIRSSEKLSDENARRLEFYHPHLVSYAEWLQDRTD
jgi:hypothetical protein